MLKSRTPVIYFLASIEYLTYLTPVWLCAPPDCGHAPVVLLFAGLDGLEAFGGVAVLVMADVALQTQS